MGTEFKQDTILQFNSPLDETNYYDVSAMIEKAKGVNLWVKGDEKPYVDLIMGYSSTNFGHANKDILRIVSEAIQNYDNIPCFNSEDKIELSQRLVNLLPFPRDKLVYYPVGGTKAVDAAIKLARAYTRKSTIISFNGGFHGYGFGGMSVTDSNYIEKTQFGTEENLTTFFDYPDRRKPDAQKKATDILDEIDGYLKQNANTVASIIFEPIQGAAGFKIPPDGFLPRLVDIARTYGVISICDEIQTGVCRTGSFYYINQVQLDPDVVLLGKSLAGGYYPLSAVIADRKMFEAVDHNRPGFDSTFANNLLAMKIANNTLQYIIDSKVIDNIQTGGKIFFDQLKPFEEMNFIKDIDGIGMAFSFRVEAPLNTLESNAKLAKAIRKEAYKNHLIIQTAGVNGDYIKLSPSFLITPREIDDVFVTLRSVLQSIRELI